MNRFQSAFEHLALDQAAKCASHLQILETKQKPKNGVLEGVHILGLTSKNNRTYEAKAVKEAMPLYEMADVYLNHNMPDKNGAIRARSVEEKFGWFENISFKATEGLFGDFHYNTKHPYAATFEWWVENAPGKIGFSHDAMVDNLEHVTEIGGVRSVDLVALPATTGGIFEGVVQDKLDADAKKLSTIYCTACSLMGDVIWGMTDAGTDQEKANKLLPIARDFMKLLRSTANAPDDAAEGKTMEVDYSKLSLKDVKEKAPALIAEAVREHVATESAIAARVVEAVKDVPEALRTKVFMVLVRESIDDAAKLKDLIEDRKSLTPAAVVTTPAQKPAQEQVALKTEEPAKGISDEDILRACGSKI